MINLNSVELHKDLSNILHSVVKYNEIINVSTKEGNVVIVSKEVYDGIMETLEICSDSVLREKILACKEENIDDCIGYDDVECG